MGKPAQPSVSLDPAETCVPDTDKRDVLILPLPAGIDLSDIELFRRMCMSVLKEWPWPEFGELNILFLHRKPHKIKRLDTMAIGACEESV